MEQCYPASGNRMAVGGTGQVPVTDGMERDRCDGPGWRWVRSRSREMDGTVRGLFERVVGAGFSGVALVALGGYGRRELCPCSDLDLLLLVADSARRDEIRAALRSVVYPLWDRKLDASYSVRTPKQTIADAQEDFLLFTSLLDARFLAGSEGFFVQTLSHLHASLVLPRCGELLEHLVAFNAQRHDRYGEDAYRLEPNVKEGHGGLRDYHGMGWVTRILAGPSPRFSLEAILSEQDRRDLEESVDFLLQVRIQLHKRSGRKNDRLLFEYQEPVARTLRFGGDTPEERVERFMKAFHRRVLTLKSHSDALMEWARARLRTYRNTTRFPIDSHLEVVSGRIRFSRPETVWREPILVFRLFEQIARIDRPLHPASRKAIRDTLKSVERLRDSEEARTRFRRVLAGKGARRALTLMLETDVLEVFLPEFGHIKGQTQFDVYHIHTVDHHSILTVDELHKLEAEEAEVFREVGNRELLFAVGLLHDIGKGSGSPHAEIGAGIAFEKLTWLGFTPEEAELGRVVIRKHLRLAEAATRRDLSEERVVFQFAREVGSVAALDLLYLLTVADSRATGPSAWSSWKASLVRELYAKARKILKTGDLQGSGAVTDLEDRWKALLEAARSVVGEEDAKSLERLSQPYILTFDLPDIIEHLKLSSKVTGPLDVEARIARKGGHFEVTILTMDRPGLFCKLAGVFALNHFDVRAAKVFTWGNGRAVDVFEVVPPWPDYEEWDRLMDHFRRAVAGRMALTARMGSVRVPVGKSPRLQHCRKARITIDNRSSDFYTVIEVEAPDRVGLLYDVTKTISEFDLNIHRAFVSNKGDLAADAFYVSDLLGQRIEDADHQREIVRALEHVLC